MKKEYPREGCGVLISINNSVIYRACKNMAVGAEEFLIKDTDWITAQLLGKVVGIVHSHPTCSSKASSFDISQSKQFNIPYHIISMVDNSMETIIP
jgi:proteasome lid subunit RPN8/RPN11